MSILGDKQFGVELAKHLDPERGKRAVLLWLASNVTDEMRLSVLRSFNMHNDPQGVNLATAGQAISAALRLAAAGEEGK